MAKIELMHQQGEAEMEKMGWQDYTGIPQGSMANLKKRWSKAFGVAIATIGQMWQIAKHRGDLWEKYHKVILGSGPQPAPSGRKGKKAAKSSEAQSAAHFTKLGDIPSEVYEKPDFTQFIDNPEPKKLITEIPVRTNNSWQSWAFGRR